MAQPNKIIIVRHAESEGNVSKEVYLKTPDYAVPLTSKGRIQASNRGVEIKRAIGEEQMFFYVSPFRRTRETFEEIKNVLGPTQAIHREDPRLREQEWFTRVGEFDREQKRERSEYGHFYYRFNGGESPADCYDRMGGFLDSLFRDFEKPNFPKHCGIITHGMAMRVLIMRWFHMTVEEFELLKNPRNCEAVVLNKQANGKYKLERELTKYEKPTHPYQFPLGT